MSQSNMPYPRPVRILDAEDEEPVRAELLGVSALGRRPLDSDGPSAEDWIRRCASSGPPGTVKEPKSS